MTYKSGKLQNDELKIVNYKKRIKRNRFKRRMMLLVLFCIAVTLFLTLCPIFDITALEVKGNENIDSARVLEAAEVNMGGNLFLAPVGRYCENVMRISYVKSAEISRRLWGKLVITITECSPVAYFREGEDYWLADGEGKLLERIQGAPTRYLPTVLTEGLQGFEEGKSFARENEQISKKYIETIDKIVHNKLLDKVTAIDLRREDKLTLSLNNLEVELKDLSRLEYKMSMLLSILEELGPNPGGRLDISNGERSYYSERVD